jgi:hypothetical protein
MQELSLGSVLSIAWERFKQNAAVALICVLIAGGISLGLAVLGSVVQELFKGIAGLSGSQGAIIAVSGLIQIIMSLVSWVVGVWLKVGLVVVFLKMARGEEPEIGEVFRQGRFVLPAMIAGLLLQLAQAVVPLLFGGVGVGLLVGGLKVPAFVVIGIGVLLGIAIAVVVYLGTIVWLYALVDRDLGIVASITEAWGLAQGHWGEIFLWLLIQIGLGFVILFTCGLGLLVVQPVIMIGTALIYDHLQGRPWPGAEADHGPAAAPTSRSSATGDAPLSAKG